MIFEILLESSERGELILEEGGLCHWHLRRDQQITIREILVVPELRNQGIGHKMLARLKRVPGATSLFAKCPVSLMAGNQFYRAEGFMLEGTETTKSGRVLNLWRLELER